MRRDYEFFLTPGNVDDRAVVENLVDKLQGWLFGDRGYISKKLTQSLANQALELITKIKSNRVCPIVCVSCKESSKRLL